MDKEYFLKNNNNTNAVLTGISLASTWIWSPAIYVSSSIAAQYNIFGLLAFLIPNVLTLLLFGYFANKLDKNSNMSSIYHLHTIFDFIKLKGTKLQYYTHLIVGCILLICSCGVQLLGLKILLLTIFPTVSVNYILVSILGIILIYTSIGGIKWSIYTDVIKYFIMLVCLFVLLFNFPYASIHLQAYETGTMLKSFGIPTIIGLMMAPYVDSTFWQRVFSIHRESINKMSLSSAFFFMLIPLGFGLIGLSQFQTNSFNIVSFFNYYPFNIILSVIICLTLIATLDSNLNAFSSIIWNELKLNNVDGYKYSIIFMLILCICGFVISLTNISIVTLFLIYGTIRTCVGIPTILMILDRYNKYRLQIFTLISVVLCSLSFIYMSLIGSSYAYIFTILAICIPILGYSSKKEV